MWAKENYPGGPNARGSISQYIEAEKKGDTKWNKRLSNGAGGWREKKARANIMNLADGEYKDLCKPSQSKPKYPLMEKEVQREFRERRAKSRKVSARWLQVRSRYWMKKKYPAVKNWKGSRGWRFRFCERMSPPLVHRRVTKIRKRDVMTQACALRCALLCALISLSPYA